MTESSSLDIASELEGVVDEEGIIPGLPDEIGELCLMRIPYPYQAPVRGVSCSWNRVIKNPGFILSKKCLSLSLPYIFVMAFHKSSARIQWQALDPQSGSWFLLPPMPPSAAPSILINPSSLACVPLQRQGQLVVLGGMHQSTTPTSSSSLVLGTVTTYHVSSNHWSIESSPMPTPRAFFTAESVADKIVVVGGSGPTDHLISSVECYDPNTDTWTQVAPMSQVLAKYDSAVIGNRVYLTEGWTWPFMFVPRGFVYDTESDTWGEMREGMREGWTGLSIVMWNRLFVMSEHGDHRLKVYVPESDSWRYVEGAKFPSQHLQKPFAVTSCCCSSSNDMMIHVISSGLNVGVGRVSDTSGGEFSVEWTVVAAPKAFRDLSPCNAHVLYA